MYDNYGPHYVVSRSVHVWVPACGYLLMHGPVGAHSLTIKLLFFEEKIETMERK